VSVAGLGPAVVPDFFVLDGFRPVEQEASFDVSFSLFFAEGLRYDVFHLCVL